MRVLEGGVRGFVLIISALTLLVGCGGDAEPRDQAANSSNSSTNGPDAARDLEYVTYKTQGVAATGDARVTGTLVEKSGCLILRAGVDRLVAFDVDRTRLDGTTIEMQPRVSAQKTLRVSIGDRIDAGGGYADYSAEDVPTGFVIPPKCAEVGSKEIAVIENW